MARRAFAQALRLKGHVPYAILLSAPSVSLCASSSDGEDFLSKIKKKVQEQSKNIKKPDIPDAPGKEEAAITISAYINAVIDSGIPSQLSWGFMSGFASGYCLKKASKLFAVFVGGAFMGIQALAYKGYIHVNHKRIEADVLEWLDLNGDGVIDSKDAVVAWELLLDVIAFNVPAGTGFTTGLVMGLRSG